MCPPLSQLKQIVESLTWNARRSEACRNFSNCLALGADAETVLTALILLTADLVAADVVDVAAATGVTVLTLVSSVGSSARMVICRFARITAMRESVVLPGALWAAFIGTARLGKYLYAHLLIEIFR